MIDWRKKSRIREKPTLLTDVDSGTDTNLKRKCDLTKKKNQKELFKKKMKKKWGGGQGGAGLKSIGKSGDL